jgi:hypothetical protein
MAIAGLRAHNKASQKPHNCATYIPWLNEAINWKPYPFRFGVLKLRSMSVARVNDLLVRCFSALLTKCCEAQVII